MALVTLTFALAASIPYLRWSFNQIISKAQNIWKIDYLELPPIFSEFISLAGAVCMSSLSLIGWTLLLKNFLHLIKSIIDRVQCSWHGDGALFNTKKSCTLKILSLPAPAVVDTAVRWPKISYLRITKNCFIALFGLRQYCRDPFILVVMFFKIIHHPRDDYSPDRNHQASWGQ